MLSEIYELALAAAVGLLAGGAVTGFLAVVLP